MFVPSIVLILGAGFSRHLGGPLMAELLSKGSEHAVNRFLSDWKPAMAAPVVRRAYEDGKEHGLWADAEGCLDYLERAADAAEGTPESFAIAALSARIRGDYDPQTLDLSAKQIVLAQCSAFLCDQSPLQERWQPYFRWLAELVKSGDNIVTFNYDRVLEQLIEHHQDLEDRFKVVCTNTNTDADACEKSEYVPVLKLHGSVDWVLDGGQPRACGKAWSPVDWKRDRLAIATPGAQKLKMARGPFKHLWDIAMTSIRRATAVVFMGYRFPPSDSHALGEISAALSKSLGQAPGEADARLAHLVLGPEAGDKSRIHEILCHALQNGGRAPDQPGNKKIVGVYDTGLYAQDFMTVASRERLLSYPYRAGGALSQITQGSRRF